MSFFIIADCSKDVQIPCNVNFCLGTHSTREESWHPQGLRSPPATVWPLRWIEQQSRLRSEVAGLAVWRTVIITATFAQLLYRRRLSANPGRHHHPGTLQC